MSQPTVRRISSCTVKPGRTIYEEPDEKVLHLTAWDFPLLSVNYIQKGLLFNNPSSEVEEEQHCQDIIDLLKVSLSTALDFFHPLAGGLVTQLHSSAPSASIFIDCNGNGAEFIHAAANIKVADVVASTEVPPIVECFFALNGAVNHDGHSLPLLAVQFTELTDGFFLGCSFNHLVGDGSSFWHFFNSWSEIYKGQISEISRPPIIKRWFPESIKPPIPLPFTNPDEFIRRLSPSQLRDRVFHFTAQSVAQLKEKANAESQTIKISSFQAISALSWISMIRARCLPADRQTKCKFSVDARSRLNPPLSRNYLGNAIGGICITTTVGQLLSNGLGWVARQLHESIDAYDDSTARAQLDSRVKAPFLHSFSNFDGGNISIGSSPRFDVYGVDFGWEKAVAVRVGLDNKFDGKITAFPGREGGGSVDLEICLVPEVMKVLESDLEFMNAVST